MNVRVVLGGLLVVIVTVGVIGGTLAAAGMFSGVELGDLRIGGPPPQGDKPGVVGAGTNESLGPNYVDTTFVFECVAAWCDVGLTETLVFRIQQVNRSEFEWEGLYISGIRDGSEVTVALYVGQRYRLLVKHPDGRIINLGSYVAEDDAEVTVRLTDEVV